MIEKLTPRETDVLMLMATGATNQQISERLFCSVGRVENIAQGIREKLGASNRTEMAILALGHFIALDDAQAAIRERNAL